MATNILKRTNIFDLISKYSLYILVFLFPIFFLPWTASATSFNKQALLLALVFISVFAWTMKILTSSKAKFSLIFLHIPVAAFFLIYIVATIFSSWRFGSFWGRPLSDSASLLTLIGLLLFYLLLSNAFEKKEIFYSAVALGASSFLAILYGILQLFGRFVVPFSFTQNASFNTIGSVNSLGLFAAVMIPLFVVLAMTNKRVLRALFIIALIASMVLLAMVDFSSAWWVVVAGSAALLIIGMQKRNVFENGWLIVPMLFLAIALLFNFFNIQIPTDASRSLEIHLAQRPSWVIGWETIKQNPILGSGPGTFVYDFAQHEKAEWFNEGNFWNVRFESAGSKLANLLATTGVLGLLSFLAVSALALFYGIKLLFFGKKEEQEGGPNMWLLGAGIFVSFVALITGYALFRSSICLEFLFFLFIGSLVALISTEKKEIKLKPSSWINLIVTFAFTVVFIFGLGLLILEGQRYAAEVEYKQGITAWAKGDSDLALQKMESAARTSPQNEIYWRELAQVYLRKVNIDAGRTDLSQPQKNQRIQIFVSNSIAAAKAATDTNPANVANWSVRGFIYQNLLGTVEQVGEWALDSYSKAQELEPSNPYYPTQKGVVYLSTASFFSEGEERQERISSAKREFREALGLKSNYAPARFQLAAAFQMESNIEGAIAELEEAKRIAPFDVGVAFQLGLINYQQGNYDSAQQELERAVGVDPNYANALYFLALVYDRQGMTGEAAEVMERVAELNPNNALVRKVLGNLNQGRSALEGLTQPQEAPIKESPPEINPEEEEED